MGKNKEEYAVENESRKLAVCIPTYERPLVINDFLCRCGKLYMSYGIDIYIYDSSKNNDTYSVFKEWIECNQKFKDNIFYQKVDSAIHANSKVYKIFKGEGLKYAYDFIWVCGDAIQVREKHLKFIMGRMDLKYDIIQINASDVEKIGIREYTNIDECLKDCAWQMTLFGAVILNSKKMLTDVDWDFYKEFLIPQLINYSHVSFYINQLHKKKDFCVLYLGIDAFKYSAYKLNSGWVNDTFSVLFESWYNTIKKLPCSDESRDMAFKKLPRYSVLRSDKDFLWLKSKGIYSYKHYCKYREKLEMIYNTEKKKLLLIAVCPKWLVNIYLRKSIVYRVVIERKFMSFCKKHSRIFMYGAGYYGALYGQYCYKNKIEFIAYCVKNISENYKEYYNHPVIELEQLQVDKKNVGIVIALADNVAIKVKKELKEKGYCNVFYNKYFANILK